MIALTDKFIVDKAAKGFTLLELMVAIAIFAILATACYRLLTTSSEAQQIMGGVWKELNALQKGHLIIEKDIRHMIARPVRDSANKQQFALSGGINKSDKQILISFTRSGHHNLTNEVRSDLMRVMYTVESGSLVRYIWFALDSITDKPPLRQLILDGLTKTEIHFLDQKNRWVRSWPPVSEDQKTRIRLLPKALYLTFNHEKYGNMQWWFLGVDTPPDEIKVLTNNDSKRKKPLLKKDYRDKRYGYGINR